MAAPTPPSTKTSKLQTAKSCSLRSDTPLANYYGSPTYLITGTSPSHRLLYVWDISSLGIPQAASIISATLRITIWSTILTTIDIKNIIGSGILPYGETTWNNRNYTTPWGTPGGDFGSFYYPLNVNISPIGTFSIEVKSAIQYAVSNGIPPAFIFIRNNSNGVMSIATEFYGNTAYKPELTITWIDAPKQRADLGALILGKAQLGGSISKLTEHESLGLTEKQAVSLHLRISEAVSMTEVYKTAKDIFISFSDSFTLTEKYRRLSDYMAGILGKIQTLLPITNLDFCEMVLESGHTIELNGTLCRAYVFIKQAGQKFDHNIITMPGDAVMFSCPDLGVSVGDTVIFDNLIYYVAGNINHLFDGNIIYVKSALQKERFIEPMPKVTGLKAAMNEDGKVLLTWDDIQDIYQLKKFNIWISSGTDFTYLDSSTSTSYTAKNLIPNTAYWFIVQAIDVYGNAGSFSNSVQCGIDNTPPAAPTGGR